MKHFQTLLDELKCFNVNVLRPYETGTHPSAEIVGPEFGSGPTIDTQEKAMVQVLKPDGSPEAATGGAPGGVVQVGPRLNPGRPCLGFSA